MFRDVAWDRMPSFIHHRCRFGLFGNKLRVIILAILLALCSRPWHSKQENSFLAGDSSLKLEPLPTHSSDHHSSLKFYMYDLPSQYNVDLVKLYESQTPRGELCGALEVCPQQGINTWSHCRENISPEITILRKFLSLPASMFTAEPNNADFFIVPYFAYLWSYLQVGGDRCPIRANPIHPNLFTKLPFFLGNEHKHIILDTTDSVHVNNSFRKSITLDFGPRLGNNIVVPLLNHEELLQESKYKAGARDLLVFVKAAWSYRERNDIMWDLTLASKHRADLLVDVQQFGQSIDAARNASFCPSPHGDKPHTKRFFDALIAGCIPVVVSHPYGGSPNPVDFEQERYIKLKYWHARLETLLRRFPPKENEIGVSFFALNPKISYKMQVPFSDFIDISSMIIQIPKDDVHDLLKILDGMKKEEVEQKQEQIHKMKRFFNYDFKGSNPDAFSMILKELELRKQAQTNQ